ncbi:MAG: 5'-nucleotidase C-terminal domain-containing protein [Halopseudomonas sp.]|uniref:bifunctional metallophosphatase/5'-nucleotidase n=1 Tax=Halopseudomonas sp. TaxID=2901191 RepID=UPI003002151C
MLDLPRKSLLGAMLSLALVGCNSDSDDDNDDAAGEAGLEINIAHINDQHSQLEAFSGTSMQLGGEAVRVDLGGFSRLTTLFAEAEAQLPNLIKLHAGDAITGTLYYTFYQGEADAQMMNTVCFDAFALGNHEFDDSDAGLKVFLDALATDDCATPVLAANVKPAVGTPLAPVAQDDYIKPYIIKEVDGRQVGIVGIDIKGKTENSSRPLETTLFLDEKQAAQEAIDNLKEQGVEHIILLTHQGYENDKALAADLSGVDVIIGGDSHSLLGDFESVGYASSGPYPTEVTNLDGNKVCIGQAWEYSKVFGLMQVKFDAAGVVESCAGQASLVIGDSFEKSDGADAFVPVSEDEKADLLALLDDLPQVVVATPDANAEAVLNTFKSQIDEKKAEVIGFANEAFCLVRVPGETTNRSAGVAGCENANLLAKGSDAAQLVAEAFLDASLRADFSLQNAGGVRVPVAAGDISYNTAFTLLPFTNVLVELDITGEEVVNALEDAVSNHLDAAESTGSQPYAAGLRWDLDMSQPKGTRFSNVQVRDGAGNWVAIEPARNYVMVTNDFIAEGRDGYSTLGEVSADGRSTNTFLLYTQSLVDYLLKINTVSPPLRADYSHQQVIEANGNTLAD